MNQLLLVLSGLILLFGFVVLFGAPYLPTLSRQTKTALDLLNLKPGQTMLELGCGDGRVLIAAASRGWLVIGYELNPVLAFVAWLRTRRYRRQVKIIWVNYWRTKLPEADGIYTFLLPKYMHKLDKKITQEFDKKVKLVSFAFPLPGKKPERTVTGLYLYIYNH